LFNSGGPTITIELIYTKVEFIHVRGTGMGEDREETPSDQEGHDLTLDK
jgi:hypothetical protein